MILPRPARARARGRTRGWSSRARPRSTRASAAAASGARPRFVWTITPVALITRRSAGCARGRSSSRKRSVRSPGSAPARISSRAASSTRRAASTASGSSSAARELVHRREVAQLHRAYSFTRRGGRVRAAPFVAGDHRLDGLLGVVGDAEQVESSGETRRCASTSSPTQSSMSCQCALSKGRPGSAGPCPSGSASAPRTSRRASRSRRGR